MFFLVLGILNSIATVILFIFFTNNGFSVIETGFLLSEVINCIMLFKWYDLQYTQTHMVEENEKLNQSLNECRKLLNLPEHKIEHVEMEDVDKDSPDYFDENSPDFEDAFMLDNEDTYEE